MISQPAEDVLHAVVCLGTERNRPFAWLWVVILGVWAVLAAALPSRADSPHEREPINYSSALADDPVARLQQRVDRGEVMLKYDEDAQGYLKSVLEQLQISPESQMLVFSKTSFQHTRIAPRTPRALYFSDDAYVGWVKGGDYLEFAAVDPKLGTTFYLLDQQRRRKPAFLRQTDSCLQCHQSSKTQDVPGLVVRSVYPDQRGLPVFSAGSFVTDHTSPLTERWGGWYVTGKLGGQRHMGNGVVTDRNQPECLNAEPGADRLDLKWLVDTYPYLTGHSDVVALMVLEHQTQTQNLITLAGYQGHMGRYYDAGINKALGRPEGFVSESSMRRIASYADKLVAALLFSGETALGAPIEGSSGFASQFAARGPLDRKGRSLRDVDLRTRLFKYPCSYLIYSRSFDSLPEPMKARVYHRLREVLTGSDTSPQFAHLSPSDRRSILEILLDTKTALPEDWETLRSNGS
jgi:hypothetical protein